MFVKPDTMKALVLEHAGEDFALTEMSVPVPEPKEGQLLIKVEYAALNPVDTKLALSGHSQWQYPHIPVLDGVGKVVASGDEHSPIFGERVIWHSDLTKQGVLAEYAVIDAHAVAVVPDEIASADAATIPCAGMTAALSICTLSAQAGDKILIEAGAGAVGQFAIQLAKINNLTVYTTASKQHHNFLKTLGADFVFDYKSDNLVDDIRETLGHERLDKVLDSIGGDVTVRDIELLKFNGSIACLNSLPELDPDLMFTKAPSIHVISLGGAWLSNDMCAQHKLGLKGSCLLELVTKKQLKLPDVIEIPFESQEVTSAMHRQLAGGLFGKQVVKIAS
ncbi:zinc-binding dehydrogenase [Thalassotalea euphylliae]|uniref:zinc-binding dehydrogenase n=1 Tax=Thalassotalea euphylliae TaxID=1655234 RepID=UPI00363D5F2F